MIIDQIKEHVVCINGGSGVLFQPSCEKTTYILTCDHVVKEKEVGYDVPVARIRIYDQESRDFTINHNILLQEKSNYFRDEKLDLAIIKIPKVCVNTDLICIEEFEKYDGNIRLCGFPNSRRVGNNIMLRDDTNITLSPDNQLGKREARIPGNLRHSDIAGQSGGAIYCLDGDRVGLLGIQNLVAVKNEELGRILFTPIKDFKSIVVSSEGLLESIEPYYIKDFTHLLSDIFNLGEERVTSEARRKMIFALGGVAKTIISADITPKTILDSIENKLLLLYNQQPDNLNIKKLWCFWLEMLVIIQVATKKNYKDEPFNDVFRKFRLFYSDINKDFFLKHLEDLCHTDYERLDTNGLVIVASNASASIKPFLDLGDIVQDISEIKEQIEFNNQLLHIDNPKPFALETYKFINISAFKDYTLTNHYLTLKEISLPSILEELFKIYGTYINR
ncbi:hypothetical protein GO495_31060 [Chitinophaga oryziterrae]|uniref:ABC-three component systems C-terminal domain-containing protein n=1 Tax=Chitinophaga oryziterrae TaxID=1031224 RepID=A0A6N8JLE8_9BACT|nr:ABC-three component system protein [Chitinophaga oryziterrae]MVT45068.1 hypothetical protein [Chitinophaga oryziterrae]